MGKRYFKRGEIWLCLVLLILLAAFSIRGAFMGAEHAREMFNSVLLMMLWGLLAVLLLVGIFSFKGLRRRLGLLMVHLGCLMLLFGAMWGSAMGRSLEKKYLGIDRLSRGYMQIFEGHSDSRVAADDTGKVMGKLPFELFLRDFRLKYYWGAGKLIVQNRNRGQKTLSVQVGREYEIAAKQTSPAGGEKSGNISKPIRVRVLREFKNFKIDLNTHKAFDGNGGRVNPALEIAVIGADGKSARRYVFRNFPERGFSDSGWKFIYNREVTGIKGYLSDVVVVQDGKAVKEQVIEVNKPMHYGGYNFFQMGYDKDGGRYTILQVSPDTGLSMVFGGFALLVVGLFVHFWFAAVGRFLNRGRNSNGQEQLIKGDENGN